MHSKHKKPFGMWVSPITSTKITTDSVSLDELRAGQSATYWIEKRPAEKGRCVIVKTSDGRVEDCFAEPYSARSRVHEYGGGAYCIANDSIYFVNDKDQNIYLVDEKKSPQRITQTNDLRFADIEFDSHRNQLICICEDHTTSTQEPVNKIVTVNILTGELSILRAGNDFYSNPRLSPDGDKLCWLSWNHPNMPWDGTELWLSNISSEGSITDDINIAGSDAISIFQPQWSIDNVLHYISDESGWWNLYQYNGSPQQLTYTKFEFGLPQWIFAQSCYAFVNKNEILCAFIDNGSGRLALFNKKNKELTLLSAPWTSYSSICAHNNICAFIAASKESFYEIITINTDELHKHKPRSFVLKSSIQNNPDDMCLSYGQVITFKTRDGARANAIYYAPANKDFTSDKNEKPPLIVLTHGGPTTMVDNSLDMRKQFWTSRGFALLDVNYSGSTGFGRAFRERLNHHWGIHDAQDCCDAALYVTDQGLADRNRLIIKGSSAGGYTVLCALSFHDTFSAGASYYGIGDLESLIADTHKFESRYTDRLVGPYPQEKTLYTQRSPLSHIDKFNCPVIFFQGLDDKVVPKEQAEQMFEALKIKGIPVSYIPFSREGHGFRKAETIKYALDAELTFYSKVFKLNRDDEISITIENIN